MTTINLTVYIDQKLLQPDPKTGQVQVGNLALARKVGGVANTIFQSKTTAYFSDQNLFQWEQAYRIGANQTPPQPSAFVKATTGPKAIAPGQICDWTNPIAGGPPLQYMPDAVLADGEFLKDHPERKGMFGTKKQPSMWYNSIWCSTGGGAYSCIYTDTATVPGMDYRAYLVENNYQVSWETSNFTPGIYEGSWTTPWQFSIADGTTSKCISWGFPPAGQGQSPIWYDYGTVDPGQHNPSKASSHSGVSMLGFMDPFQRTPVHMRVAWTGPSYTDDTKRRNASAVFQYLSKSTHGWLNLTNIYIGTYLSGDIGLQSDTAFGDYLPGETEKEKVLFYIRALINNIAPKYAPTNLDWSSQYPITEQSGTEGLGVFKDFFKLAWQNLPLGTTLAAATHSAAYIKDLITRGWNSTHTSKIQLDFTHVVPAGNGQATTTFQVSNLNQEQWNQALNFCQTIVAAEHDRKVPVPGQPDLPSPDDVNMSRNTNATAEELFLPAPVPENRMLGDRLYQGHGSSHNGEPERERVAAQVQQQQPAYPENRQSQFEYGYTQQPSIAVR